LVQGGIFRKSESFRSLLQGGLAFLADFKNEYLPVHIEKLRLFICTWLQFQDFKLEILFFGRGRNLEGKMCQVQVSKKIATDEYGKNSICGKFGFSRVAARTLAMVISRATLMLAWLAGTVAGQIVRFLAPQARCCSA
jgi:hypothetical protein